MKFRNKTTGEEYAIEEPAATIIKQCNLEIIDLKAKILKLEQLIDIMSDARRNDIPDFLKGFGRK